MEFSESSSKGHSRSASSPLGVLHRFFMRNRFKFLGAALVKLMLTCLYVVYMIKFRPPPIHSNMNSHVTCPDATESSLPSVFCFVFAVPNSFEVDLLKLHLSLDVIAGCDGFAIYSNVTPAVLLSHPTHLPGSSVIDGPVISNPEDSKRTQVSPRGGGGGMCGRARHMSRALGGA
jgi:hypothetical protein